MGQGYLQVTLDHLDSSGHRLYQFSGLAPDRVHPSDPFSEQISGLLGIFPVVATLKHEPYLISHTRRTPFHGHLLPLLGLLLRPVHLVLEPHPPRLLQLVPLASAGTAPGLPNLGQSLY